MQALAASCEELRAELRARTGNPPLKVHTDQTLLDDIRPDAIRPDAITRRGFSVFKNN